MRRFTVSLALSAFAVPALALAAFTAPSDLFRALQLRNAPMELAYEFHMHSDDFYLSAWIRGAAQGKRIEDAKSDIRMTLHAEQPGTARLQAKAQMRVVESTLYVRLDEVTGTFMGTDIAAEARRYEGTWYALPLEPATERSVQTADYDKLEPLVWDVLDAMLSMELVPDAAPGSTYSLRLKRTAWKDMVEPVSRLVEAATGEEMPEPSSRELAQIRKMLNKLNLHIKIMTDDNDVPTGLKFYMAIKENDVDAVFLGTATVRSENVTVRAPAGAVPLEQHLQSIQNDQALDLKDMRDAQRRSDVNTILNAVYQYAIDTNGSLPDGITTQSLEICATGATSCRGLVDLSVLQGTYLIRIPTDPEDTVADNGTGYRIWQDANGRITVEAPHAEGEQEISVTR